MAQKQLTSHSKLSEFDHGVVYELLTYKDVTEIDAETANKLADAILTSNDVKFVKIKTALGGMEVINISDIKRIRPNEARARAIIDQIRQKLQYDADKSYDHIALAVQSMIRRSMTNGNYIGKEASREEFDYFYQIETERHKRLEK